MTTPNTVAALMALVDDYAAAVHAFRSNTCSSPAQLEHDQYVLKATRAAVEASVRALAAIPEQQAGGVPAGWRETAELVWDALTGSHAGDLSADGQAKYMRAVQALDNLLSAHSPSAVQPTVEQAIVQLVEALVQSKGWLHAYADSVVRDAIDRKEAQPPSVVDKSMLKRLVTQVFGEEFQITRAVQPLSEVAALKQYLQECDDNEIEPDVGGAWAACWRAAHGIVTPKEPGHADQA